MADQAPVLQLPAPLHAKPSTTRDLRLRIQHLHFDAGWQPDRIVAHIGNGITLRQVRYALKHRPTLQKNKSGRYLLIDTPKRKVLID